MKKILFLIDWFEPAFKAGGPLRSISNMARLLANEYEVFVLTGDRDLGEMQSLKNIKLNQWTVIEQNIQVCYLTPGKHNWKDIKTSIQSIDPHFIYCSGLYSRYFSIYPLLMKRLSMLNTRFVLAPHGMLKASALSYKPLKKILFLQSFKLLGAYNNIYFHASGKEEAEDIRRQFGNVKITEVPDAPSPVANKVELIIKEKGALKLLFIGRIHPIKNLGFLLNALQFTKHSIQLTIIGTPEDKGYWNKCQEIIKRLPVSIKVSYLGEASHDLVRNIILQHHLFCLPTRGENFGHAIYEALSAGRPVLISDQTPWRNLHKSKSGWDLALRQPKDFSILIDTVAEMEQEEFNEWCYAAWQYCNNYLQQSDIRRKYIKLFS